MAKLTLQTIATLRQNSALTELNENFDDIETAIENTLSRDGTSPNMMGASLDMNSNPILNLREPQLATEPLRLVDGVELLLEEIVYEPTDGTINFATIALAQAYNPATAPTYIWVAGYSSAGDGGAALYKKVGAEPSHTGKFQIAEGSWYELKEYPLSAAMFGAHPTATASTNTAAINNAINMANARGGGEVVIPYIENSGSCIYQVSATTQTNAIVKYTDPDSTLDATACIVIKDKVVLRLEPGIIIENSVSAHDLIAMYDCENGAGVYCPSRANRAWVRGTWDAGEVLAGTLHGVHTYVSDKTKNSRVFVKNLRISNVDGYGMGISFGANKGNEYSGNWVHDVGRGGIDHKSRGGVAETTELIRSGGNLYQINLCVDNYFERTSQDGGDACIDWRGPGIISRNICREFSTAAINGTGIRLSSGDWTEDGAVDEFREPAAFSIISDNIIDNINPDYTTGTGIQLLSAPHAIVSGNTIRNCGNIGINLGGTAGNANKGRVTLSDNDIEGCWLLGVDIGGQSTLCLFSGLRITGAVDKFDSVRGNLIAGQTVFNTDRPFNSGTVIVRKNGVTLTGGGVDYTVTDTDTITLTAAVLVSDEILIITPTAVGVDNNALYTSFFNYTMEYVTTPFTHDTGGTPDAAETVMLMPGATEDRAGIRSYHSATVGLEDRVAILEAFTDHTVSSMHIKTKGTGWLVQSSDVPDATNGSFAFNKRVNEITNDSNQSWSAAQLRAGVIERSGMTADRTDTTPSAANIVGVFHAPQVGTSFELILANKDNAQNWLVTGGTNVTIIGSTTIAANTVKRALVNLTNVGGGTEAVTIYIP